MLITILILSVIAAVGGLADLFAKYFIAYPNYIPWFSVSMVLIFEDNHQSNDK